MSVIAIRERKINDTRKPHQCEWCPEEIPVGDPAYYRAYTFEGAFHSAYMHPECYDAMLRSDIDGEGFEEATNSRGVDEFGNTGSLGDALSEMARQ